MRFQDIFKFFLAILILAGLMLNSSAYAKSVAVDDTSYISHLNREGLKFVEENNPGQARESFLKALRAARKNGDSVLVADLQFNLAKVAKLLDDSYATEVYFSKALDLYERLGRHDRVVNIYNEIGEVYRKQEQYRLARSNYSMALKLSRKAGYERGEAETSMLLARSYEDGLNFSLAEAYYTRARQISLKLGDAGNVATAYRAVGMMKFRSEEYLGAQQEFFNAFRYSSRTSDYAQLADLGSRLSLTCLLQGDLAGSVIYFRHAVENDERAGRTENLAADYSTLGFLHANLGNAEQAEHFYLKSIRIGNREQDFDALALSFVRMGDLKQALGDLSEAEKCYRDAFRLNSRYGREGGIPLGAYELVLLYLEQDRDFEADDILVEFLEEIGAGDLNNGRLRKVLKKMDARRV